MRPSSFEAFFSSQRVSNLSVQRSYRFGLKRLRIASALSRPGRVEGAPGLAPRVGTTKVVITKKGIPVKKLAIALLSSVGALIAAQASHAQGQLLCIDFVNFCDGMEIMINDVNGDGAVSSGDSISGSWVNTDCAGARSTIEGGVVSKQKHRIACAPAAACPAGIAWLFIYTALPQGGGVSTFDMVGSFGPGQPPFPQQIDQPWGVSQGACAFANDGSGVPSSMAR